MKQCIAAGLLYRNVGAAYSGRIMKLAPLNLIEIVAALAVVAAWALVSASADDVNRREDAATPATASAAVIAVQAPR